MSAAGGWALAALALAVILAYDAWLVKNKKRSMSKAFWQAIAVRPFIVFILGFGMGYVSGHLTWPSEECFRAILQDVLR